MQTVEQILSGNGCSALQKFLCASRESNSSQPLLLSVLKLHISRNKYQFKDAVYPQTPSKKSPIFFAFHFLYAIIIDRLFKPRISVIIRTLLRQNNMQKQNCGFFLVLIYTDRAKYMNNKCLAQPIGLLCKSHTTVCTSVDRYQMAIRL